nr:uncharacterized protein LOC129526576 [Gorilla gorilla gorilla]
MKKGWRFYKEEKYYYCSLRKLIGTGEFGELASSDCPPRARSISLHEWALVAALISPLGTPAPLKGRGVFPSHKSHELKLASPAPSSPAPQLEGAHLPAPSFLLRSLLSRIPFPQSCRLSLPKTWNSPPFPPAGLRKLLPPPQRPARVCSRHLLKTGPPATVPLSRPFTRRHPGPVPAPALKLLVCLLLAPAGSVSPRSRPWPAASHCWRPGAPGVPRGLRPPRSTPAHRSLGSPGPVLAQRHQAWPRPRSGPPVPALGDSLLPAGQILLSGGFSWRSYWCRSKSWRDSDPEGPRPEKQEQQEPPRRRPHPLPPRLGPRARSPPLCQGDSAPSQIPGQTGCGEAHPSVVAEALSEHKPDLLCPQL